MQYYLHQTPLLGKLIIPENRDQFQARTFQAHWETTTYSNQENHLYNDLSNELQRRKESTTLPQLRRTQIYYKITYKKPINYKTPKQETLVTTKISAHYTQCFLVSSNTLEFP